MSRPIDILLETCQDRFTKMISREVSRWIMEAYEQGKREGNAERMGYLRGFDDGKESNKVNVKTINQTLSEVEKEFWGEPVPQRFTLKLPVRAGRRK